MVPEFPAHGSLSASTSPSLLERASARDGAAWMRLVNLYGPTVYRWARKAGLPPHDAEDVVQNVFVSVASNLANFRHCQPSDTFRGWLATVCRHKILDFFRSRQKLVSATGGSTAQHLILQVSIPEPDSEEADCERRRMRHRAVELLRDQFECDTWQAFVRTVVHGDRAADVANDLGISVASVYRAKTHVMTRLQSELDGL